MSYKLIDDEGTIRHYNDDGKLHREDSPAVEYVNGDEAWYLNDELHREDGPAILYINERKEWWLNGIEYSEKEYKKLMRSKKLKDIL